MTVTTIEHASIAEAGEAALLRRLYRTMAAVRRLDADGAVLEREGLISGYVRMRGQEAAQVGSAAALDAGHDVAFPPGSGLGVAVATGVDPAAFLLSHAGERGTRWDAALGWALGAKLDRTGGAALAYIGEDIGTPEELRQVARSAVASQLPVVFFGAAGHVLGVSGIPRVPADGDDVSGVYAATAEALARARAGCGPVLVAVTTPRSARDPLALCEQRLRRTGTVGDGFFAEVADTAALLAERVRADVAALAHSESSGQWIRSLGDASARA
jgi:pyruvate dehydrogenase E1 component alpha subunit